MGNGDKVLIVSLPYVALLLPERVLADNDRSYPLFHQKVNDALTGGVQVVIDPSVTFVRDAFHLLRHPFAVIFGKSLLELLHALIIPLVPRFERTTVNQARDKALMV